MPGVYVRVDAFRDWIVEHGFCSCTTTGTCITNGIGCVHGAQTVCALVHGFCAPAPLGLRNSGATSSAVNVPPGGDHLLLPACLPAHWHCSLYSKQETCSTDSSQAADDCTVVMLLQARAAQPKPVAQGAHRGHRRQALPVAATTLRLPQ